MLDKVRIVRVQQRSLHHRRRQIGRRAAIGKEIAFEPNDLAIGFETDSPATQIRMPFSGHAHVGIFVVDHSRCAAGFGGDQRRHQRGDHGLSFFATKRATHSLADADDLMHLQLKHFGDHRLDLGRVLSR